MKRKIFSTILVAFVTLTFTVSSNFSIVYDQSAKEPTQPIMYLNGDDEDIFNG